VLATLAGFALVVSSAMADTHFAMRVAGLISLMAKTLASTSSGRGISEAINFARTNAGVDEKLRQVISR
jgi:hypothetical protein